jgi:hypothetical protein
MCKAYAETGLFVLVYLVCSLCHTDIDLPFWPTYELLQVLHFSLYIPLDLILWYCIAELFVYCVCGFGYFVYKWTVISKCDPFFLLMCF